MHDDPMNARPQPDVLPPRPVMRLAVPSVRPTATRIMAVVLILVWLATTAVGYLYGLGLNGSQNSAILVLMGAKYNPLIAAGQYWRLFTANFLHIGIVHLGFNTYALLLLGTDMEQRFGHGRFLALYLLAGLGGSVLSFLGNDALSAGASGAIFGLVGAMITFFLTYRDQFGHYGQRRLSSLLLVAGYNLAMGFVMPGIDNLGHIGGLLVGLALGWAYCPRYEVVRDGPLSMPRLEDRHSPLRGLVISLLVMALLVALVGLRVPSVSV